MSHVEATKFGQKYYYNRLHSNYYDPLLCFYEKRV